MSEVNIDAELVKNGEARLDRTEEKLVEMSNGCICCTLREDLIEQVRELAAAKRYDYLLIESTGIGEPMPVAASFAYEDEEGNTLASLTRLDTMVTVVDGANFLRHLESTDNLLERGLSVDESDDRTIVDLLVDQIEFADVIVLNKLDLVDAQKLPLIEGIIRKLNPAAQIVHTHFGNLDLATVLNTKRFSFEVAAQSAGWAKEIAGEHTPETEEYGISSFVYRRDRPFHPARFSECIRSEWPGVVRSKGFFWLASRPEIAGLWSQAGAACRTEPAGFWAQTGAEEEIVTSAQHVVPGKQEIVLIGVEMDRPALTAMLDRCLLTDLELAAGTAAWRDFVDPFPVWTVAVDGEDAAHVGA